MVIFLLIWFLLGLAGVGLWHAENKYGQFSDGYTGVGSSAWWGAWWSIVMGPVNIFLALVCVGSRNGWSWG